MDNEEELLLEAYGRLSRRSQLIALSQIVYGAEIEENARKIAGGQRSAFTEEQSGITYKKK